MRIACLTIGDLKTPSTWYRIGQYLPFFEKAGVKLDLISKNHIDFNHLKKFDLILNQKNLFSKRQWKKFIGHSNVVFDFDDALWTRPIKPYNWLTQLRIDHRLKFWLEHSKQSFVANSYLADYAKKSTNNVSVLPMSLDLNIWRPGIQDPNLIGWSGAPHNFHYLEKIQTDLLKLKKQNPHIKFAIHSGQKPKLKIPFEYVPFKKGEEHLFVQRLGVGLLPLDSDPYSQGKSPIKALQYLACGVPIVTNGTGATSELLKGNAIPVKTTWYDALANKDNLKLLSQNGRFIAEENHDLKKCANHFIEALKKIYT